MLKILGPFAVVFVGARSGVRADECQRSGEVHEVDLAKMDKVEWKSAPRDVGAGMRRE